MEYLEKLYTSLEPIFETKWFPYLQVFLIALLVISLFKTISKLPKLAMYPILFASSAILFMTWVYNRNEPAFLTPFVDALSNWLPTK